VSAAAVRLATIAVVGGVLVVLLAFAPSLQAPFLVPKLAALHIAAAIGLVAFGLQRAATGRPLWTRSVATGALLVVGTSGLAWLAAAHGAPGAPYAFAAVARTASLFGMACGASVLAGVAEARQRALEATVLAAAAVAAIGLLQHVELLPVALPVISVPGSTFGNRNIAAEAMAMAMPLGVGAAFAAPRLAARGTMLGAVALACVFLAVTRTRGAWIGGACGLGTTLVSMRARRPRAWASGALAAAIVAAAVAVSLPSRLNPRDVGDSKRYSGIGEVLQESFDGRSTALRTRFGLWRRTLAMIADAPLLGVGPGNWPVVFPRYAEPGAAGDGVLSATLAPRQAHDDFLERAAETGVVGLAALAFLGAALTVAARRRLRAGDEASRAATAGAAGSLAALGSLAVASFPLEMPGTLALAGLAIGLVGAEGPAPEPQRPGTAPVSPASPASRARAFAWVAMGVVLLIVSAVRAQRDARSSRWLATAERALRHDHDAGGAAVAMGALHLALEADPDDFRARLRESQMLLREHRAAEAVAAARRALRSEPASPNALGTLASAELEAGDLGAARADASRALSVLHAYPLALKVRAEAAARQGDAGASAQDVAALAALAAGPDDDDTARAARALSSPAQPAPAP
jgi:O-antigen ligase